MQGQRLTGPLSLRTTDAVSSLSSGARLSRHIEDALEMTLSDR